MRRKGFPESYDRSRFVTFLADIKSGKGGVRAPVYSHLVYDVIPGEHTIIDRPDILVVEGLNILQPGPVRANGEPVLFASDFIDFSIYTDADPAHIEAWYMERFFHLRETAFTNPASFFRRYAEMSKDEAGRFGLDNWRSIKSPQPHGEHRSDPIAGESDPEKGRRSSGQRCVAAAYVVPMPGRAARTVGNTGCGAIWHTQIAEIIGCSSSKSCRR